MKVIGKGSIHFYQPEDEIAHPPDVPSEDWNDSAVIYVWDTENGVYSFLRAGHEPGRTPPTVSLWSSIWIPGEFYKLYDRPPIRPQDNLKNGIGAGPTCQYTYENGKHCWKVRNGEVSADFEMEDFHPAMGFWPQTDGSVASDVAKGHIEASGRVRGTVKFRDRTFHLKNALGYRDHSWGIRKYHFFRTHRWTPALFGSDLTIQAFSWYGADGSLTKFGYIRRGDEILVPKDVDIVSFIEIDGITNRGGMAKLTLENGEVFDCRFEPLAPGAVSYQHSYPCQDTMCKVTLNGGERVGVGCFEATNNTTHGLEKPNPKVLVGGIMDNGIFRI
jgi:hypothetical protein